MQGSVSTCRNAAAERGDLTTDARGNATVRFTAPGVNSPAKEALVAATPFGNGDPSTSTRAFTILLSGSGAPAASFNGRRRRRDVVTWSPLTRPTPTLDGLNCLDDCTYGWDFGDGIGNRPDGVASLRPRGHLLRGLTVTSPAGKRVATSLRTVVVGAARRDHRGHYPVADRRKSRPGVYFDGSSSTTPDGDSIVQLYLGLRRRSPQETVAKLPHRYELPQDIHGAADHCR